MNRANFCHVLGLSILLLAGLSPRRLNAGIVPGDCDNDCDVDAADFQHFRTCALGAGVVQTNPICADARLDADVDVDLDDFGIFQRCYSGSGHPADPNCNHTCVGADCNCLCGQTSCTGTCTSTKSDSANCGACGNVCAAGLTCQNGSCTTLTCPAPLVACGGVCTDLTYSNGNCGSCGHHCTTDETCVGSLCEPSQPCPDCRGG